MALSHGRGAEVNDVTPGLEWGFPSSRSSPIEPASKRLLLLGFFALAVVFAAAAFFRVEEALVGVAVAVELAFLRATRLGFFSVGAEVSNGYGCWLWPWLRLEPGLVVAATFLATACTSSSSLPLLGLDLDPRGCVRLETRTLPPLPKADRLFPTGNRPAWRFPDGMACGVFCVVADRDATMPFP